MIYIPTRYCVYLHCAQCHACNDILRGRPGRECMVVGSKTTYAISAYYHRRCEFESRSGRGVRHYVIKFVSGLRHVLRFPPPITLTATTYLKHW